MDSGVIERLEALRPEIKGKWETLLRVEPVSSPLASPDALVHLIDWTLDTIFHALRAQHAHRRSTRSGSADAAASFPSLCKCGLNPLLAYFVAGEQAMIEHLVLLQARDVRSSRVHAEAVPEMKHVLAVIARREIEAFCAVCQHRHDHRAMSHPQPASRR